MRLGFCISRQRRRWRGCGTSSPYRVNVPFARCARKLKRRSLTLRRALPPRSTRMSYVQDSAFRSSGPPKESHSGRSRRDKGGIAHILQGDAINNGDIQPRPITSCFWIAPRGKRRTGTAPTASAHHCRGMDVALRRLLRVIHEWGNTQLDRRLRLCLTKNVPV